VLNIVKKACKTNCLSVEEFIVICQRYKQTEAEAVLQKKLGNYCEAIKVYLQLMKSAFEPKIMTYKKELYLAYQNEKVKVKMADVKIDPITGMMEDP